MKPDEFNRLVLSLWGKHSGPDRDDAQRWMRKSSFQSACEELIAKMNIKFDPVKPARKK